MMKLFLLWALLLLPVGPAAAQEIKMSQTAPLEQVYGETVEDDALLPMNELDMDFGYALYETTVDVEEENPTLTIENVRDYAVVYADGKLQGYLKDSRLSRLGLFCVQGQAVRLFSLTDQAELQQRTNGATIK